MVSLLSLKAAADPTLDIWKAKCKSCHGATGGADTKEGKKEKVRDMREPAWQAEWTDAEIQNVIRNGSIDNKKMKPFKDKLSTDEIVGLNRYIREVGGVLVEVVAHEPPPPPSVPERRAAPDPVVFNSDRQQPEVRAEAQAPSPPVPVVRPPATPRPVRPLQLPPPPPSSADAPAEDPPPVKVRVNVTPAPEDAAEEPSWFGNAGLSILAIGLSIVALVVALRRKR